MLTLIIAIFIIGYLMIALEHPLKINKAASALLTGTILWVLYIMNAPDFESLVSSDGFKSFVQDPHAAGLSLLEQCQQYIVEHQILISIGEICQTLIFLIGAMIIVELVDVHGGFEFITNRITTRKARSLLIMISVLTFFMSSVLDNLTTSIVMIMLIRKIIADQKTRWLFGSMIIIAANSGGAWSPIGDVTTIMLWIKGNISTSETIPHLILPSLVSMFVPLFLMARQLKGSVESPIQEGRMDNNPACCTDEFFILAHRERLYIFILGILCLLFVPVFKMVTHLPPFMGVMIGVSILWFFTEFIYGKKEDLEEDRKLRVSKVVHRIDGATLLFFLGILLAVEVLRYTGILGAFASWLDDSVGNVFIVNMVIGALSAVVDNVPLVAGAIGMYPVMTEEAVAASADPIYWMNFVQDGTFWQFLAYCAGVGGSMLIIGSAAGVVVMGLEQISFGWYLKRISGLALLGYLAGAFVYILQCVVF